MAAFFKFLLLAAGLAVIAMTLRGVHREMGAVFALAAGAALLILLLDELKEALGALRGLMQYTALDDAQLSTMFKVLGVSFLSEFAAQACRDAGENSMALRVELCGKLTLVTLSFPLLNEIAQIILELTV